MYCLSRLLNLRKKKREYALQPIDYGTLGQRQGKHHAGDVTPLQLAKHLTDEIIIDKNKSVFTKERTIVNIKPTTVINEFNNEK